MNCTRIVLLVLAINLALPSPAHAYLDPGSGVMILQILAAIGIGIMVYFQKVRDVIKRIFRIGNPSRAEKDEEPGE
jgi:hypothetical protein